MLCRRLCLLLLAACLSAGAGAQPQPRPAEGPNAESPPGKTPRGALVRALTLPGWGQLYNDQPVKAAVVWGGLGALGAGVVLQQQHYLRLRHAAVYAVCTDTDPATTCADATYARFAGDASAYTGYRADALRSLRDRARRNRDLFVLGTAAGYALQALDAYVSAHLRTFDVDEGLSFRLAPTPSGPRASVRVALP